MCRPPESSQKIHETKMDRAERNNGQIQLQFWTSAFYCQGSKNTVFSLDYKVKTQLYAYAEFPRQVYSRWLINVGGLTVNGTNSTKCCMLYYSTKYSPPHPEVTFPGGNIVHPCWTQACPCNSSWLMAHVILMESL